MDFLKIADYIEVQSIKNIIDSVFTLFEYKTYNSDMKIFYAWHQRERNGIP